MPFHVMLRANNSNRSNLVVSKYTVCYRAFKILRRYILHFIMGVF